MSEIHFDNSRYLQESLSQILERAQQCHGKLYLDIKGKLLQDSFAHQILASYELDNKKKLFAQLSDQAELLLAISAQDIIKKPAMTKEKIAFLDYVEYVLKKFENSVHIKPQIVITEIQVENMYDIIFSFEKMFHKKGYKVWEKYLTKGYPFNKKYILSEDGFGDDDHIPIFKKIALVTSLNEGPDTLKLILSQIYRDHEIGIPSSLASFQSFPMLELPQEHPINQAWKHKKNTKLSADSLGKTIDIQDQEKFEIIKNLLREYISAPHFDACYPTVSSTIINPICTIISDFSSFEPAALDYLKSLE